MIFFAGGVIMKDWIGNKTSSLVCNGAHNYSTHEREKHDFYATNPKALELLLNFENFDKNIWECACGKGHLSEVLKSNGYNVLSTDLIDRGYGDKYLDFLNYDGKWTGDIITNPPYKYAKEFVFKAMEIIPVGKKVAMFLKLSFLESFGRKELFDTFPPKYKKTDFTGTGFYYIIDEEKKTKLLKKLDGEFDTNIYAGDTCDNVSCANQIVQVPKNHYNQMKLLIVAEYGTYAGEFSFMKDKSKRYSIWVEADEWISDNPKKNPVWDDVIGFRSENEVVNESRNHSIYEVTCELNSDEYVNAIKLPFCPNMHIFAITLITSGTDNQKVLR